MKAIQGLYLLLELKQLKIYDKKVNRKQFWRFWHPTQLITKDTLTQRGQRDKANTESKLYIYNI